MKSACTLWLGSLALASLVARAQTTLPAVKVTAPAYSSQHGGYLISGDFKVDPRMPAVVFPAQALVKDDILSIEPIRLQDNEYLVLQECASADCHQASLVRFWKSVVVSWYAASIRSARASAMNSSTAFVALALSEFASCCFRFSASCCIRCRFF